MFTPLRVHDLEQDVALELTEHVFARNFNIAEFEDVIASFENGRKLEASPLQPSMSYVMAGSHGVEKSILLASIFSSHVLKPTGCGFTELAGQTFDLVINATSAGLDDAALPLPPGLFASDGLAYEMVYGKDTAFLAQARNAGIRMADGRGMLVEQAAESFLLWRGVRPDTAQALTLQQLWA